MKKRSTSLPVLVLLGLAALAAVAQAQEPVDRILAVVEKKPIFASDIEGALAEEIYLRQMRGQPLPASEAEMAELRNNLLDAMIDRQIVLEKARKEGISVTRPEVEDALNSWVVDLMQSAGSEQAFMAELQRQGMTMRGLKDRYRKDLREQLIISKFMRTQFATATVDEVEVREFYDTKYDSIPEIPAVVGISHILIVPKPAPEKEGAVLAEVSRALDRLGGGEPFEDVARDMSEDALTRDSGGFLGTVSREDLGPEIADAVSGVEPGEISQPTRTRYGFEILKVDDESDGMLTLRHIFFKLLTTAADTSAASDLAQEVRERAVSGESFEDLAREYSDDDETAETGGYVGEVDVAALGEPHSSVVGKMSPGEVSPVLPTDFGFQIVKLISRAETRKATYEDSKEYIRNLLESRARERQFQEWLGITREEIFVRRYAN
jgi:peptidyl-prolyl cis-trans isomerase SurA